MSRTADPQKGFTILEVMIVLAVGGLILLIIFMAVPALQRNSHNTQRKQDASAVLDAISQYRLNNSGTFPVDDADNTFTDDVLPKIQLHFYTSDDVSTTGYSVGNSAPENANDDTIKVYNRSKCSPDDDGQPTSRGAGYSDVIVLFAVETSTGRSPQCIEL